MMNLLFVHWNVDPVLFHIGGLQVRWYGLLFASVFVIGWYLFKWFFTREKADTRLMDPLFASVFVATIVGARLGHCIFYQPDCYFGSWSGFLEIFMLWKGGLASHGPTASHSLPLQGRTPDEARSPQAMERNRWNRDSTQENC